MVIIVWTYVSDSNHHVLSSVPSFSPSRPGRASPRCCRRCSGRSCRSSACRWCRSPCRSRSCHRPGGTRTAACCPPHGPRWSRSRGSGTWWSCGAASDWCLQYRNEVTILSSKKWLSGSVALWPHLLLYREVAGPESCELCKPLIIPRLQHNWYITAARYYYGQDTARAPPLSNCDGEDDGAEREILITTFLSLSWAKLLRSPRKFYQSNPTIWNCPITMKNHTFLSYNSTPWEII